jgi:hypothetical protein
MRALSRGARPLPARHGLRAVRMRAPASVVVVPVTEREKLRQLVQDEAERLESEFGDQIVSLACDAYGYDAHVALSTYARDGVPWYVTKAKAALLGLSVEEQLRRAA